MTNGACFVIMPPLLMASCFIKAAEAAHHGPHPQNHIRAGHAGPLLFRGAPADFRVRHSTHTVSDSLARVT